PRHTSRCRYHNIPCHLLGIQADRVTQGRLYLDPEVEPCHRIPHDEVVEAWCWKSGYVDGDRSILHYHKPARPILGDRCLHAGVVPKIRPISTRRKSSLRCSALCRAFRPFGSRSCVCESANSCIQRTSSSGGGSWACAGCNRSAGYAVVR